MGQTVVINDVVEVADLLMIDTDRSFTGQDGHSIILGEEGTGVPGLLGSKLYGMDLGIDHVYVLQNMVTLRRPGGWDAEAVESVKTATEEFLRFY